MKKIILTCILGLLLTTITYAENKFYIPIIVPNLAAGSTIKITITSGNSFTIDGTSYTNYTQTYVIPSTLDGKTVTGSTLYSIWHGQLLVQP